MLQVYDDKQSFLNDHLDFLERDEVTNGLMIGLMQRHGMIPDLLIAVTKDDRRLLGMIAGRKMILAADTHDSSLYRELVEYMRHVDYPGIIGEKSICDVYAHIFQKIIGQPMIKEMDQRIYSCATITHVCHDEGIYRNATMNDVKTLIPWAYDFEVMVEGHADIDAIGPIVEARVQAGVLRVLEVNGEIVSMAQRTRPLRQTETVSYVFTPIAKRKRGYATRIVELLTKEIHDEGRIATLYTDLGNPTSNKIYMDIGYRPHCDSIVYRIDR